MVYMAIKYLISNAIYICTNECNMWVFLNVWLDTYVCINEKERYFCFLKEYQLIGNPVELG